MKRSASWDDCSRPNPMRRRSIRSWQPWRVISVRIRPTCSSGSPLQTGTIASSTWKPAPRPRSQRSIAASSRSMAATSKKSMQPGTSRRRAGAGSPGSGIKDPRLAVPTGRAGARVRIARTLRGAHLDVPAGCCWVTQWMAPRPHTRGSQSRPSTWRSGNRSRSTARAVASCGHP